jgi:phosphonate transport system ATP-binding protein
MSSSNSSESTQILLEAKNLGLKLDGRWLFRKLDLQLKAGEFFAVTGPSGAGKTSLLQTIAGLREPSEGSISYHFPEMMRKDEAKEQLGIIFQDLLLIPNASLLTNVLCGGLRNHSSLRTFFGFPSEERVAAYALLREFGLGEAFTKWTSETSRGEQQRVAVARALHQDPALYLADEPVASLDAKSADLVLARLAKEASEKKKGVSCVLHDLQQVENYADRVLELDRENPENWRIKSLQGDAK